MITTNYGLAGGKLDATQHIERARNRLCYPSEISAYEKSLNEIAVLSAMNLKGTPENN